MPHKAHFAFALSAAGVAGSALQRAQRLAHLGNDQLLRDETLTNLRGLSAGNLGDPSGFLGEDPRRLRHHSGLLRYATGLFRLFPEVLVALASLFAGETIRFGQRSIGFALATPSLGAVALSLGRLHHFDVDHALLFHASRRVHGIRARSII